MSHENRDDLVGEHRVGDAGQIIFAGLFAAVWIADTFFLNSTTALNRVLPLAVRLPIGLLLAVCSGYLARSSLSIVFGETREIPGVIRKGAFGVVRHPIYLSELLLYLGLLIISVSLAAAAVWVLIWIFLHYISRHEERLLLDRFGDDYRRYMRDVPMWRPRWRRR